MSGKPEVWNPRTWAILDRRWEEGLSTSKIGLELGVTKNSVVSQARTRHLPKRDNPIIAMLETKRLRILALHAEGMSQANIIRETGLGQKAVQTAIERAFGVRPARVERRERASPQRVMPRPPPAPTLAALGSVAQAVVAMVEASEEVREEAAKAEDWDFSEYEVCRAREEQNKLERWQCRYMVHDNPWIRCEEQIKHAETPYCHEHHKGCFTRVP